MQFNKQIYAKFLRFGASERRYLSDYFIIRLLLSYLASNEMNTNLYSNSVKVCPYSTEKTLALGAYNCSNF